jgi:hypothetical protein
MVVIPALRLMSKLVTVSDSPACLSASLFDVALLPTPSPSVLYIWTHALSLILVLSVACCYNMHLRRKGYMRPQQKSMLAFKESFFGMFWALSLKLNPAQPGIIDSVHRAQNKDTDHGMKCLVVPRDWVICRKFSHRGSQIVLIINFMQIIGISTS